MEFITACLIAIGLAMDAFAVSLGVGTAGCAPSRRAKLRMAFHFGWFQAMMTVIGWLAGATIATFIDGFDHWIALGLLAYVGINMIRAGLNPEMESYPCDPTRGRTLVMLSVATSLDAMAVGLSMAMIKSEIVMPAIIIGVITLGLSGFGLAAGSKLGEKFGKKMEVVGGIILLFIGLRILITHLFPGVIL
ncbi:MAG TPA: manganese efflux pump MntP family protein [Anaerolineaceae bacterium]|nr:manganese efflux pump MntP family protein [Anaerolineaceae bacterium]HPN51900.1 manganese efflux pump MntP family protein [Anaerolineaceae bacterium]